MLTFSLLSLLEEVGGAPSALRRVLHWKIECFPFGCRKHFEWIFDEQSQLSTALVEKEELPCRDIVFAGCTHRYQVSGN